MSGSIASCCEKITVKIDWYKSGLFKGQADKIKEEVKKEKIDIGGIGKASDIPYNSPESKIDCSKKANRIIPLGLMPKRDVLKFKNGQTEPATSSHIYDVAPNKKYADEEQLACFDFSISIQGCKPEGLQVFKRSSIEILLIEGSNEISYFKDECPDKMVERQTYPKGVPEILTTGIHRWQWDGYDNNGVFDTKKLRDGTFIIRFTANFIEKCPQNKSGNCQNKEADICYKRPLSFKVDEKARWLNLYIIDDTKTSHFKTQDVKPDWARPQTTHSYSVADKFEDWRPPDSDISSNPPKDSKIALNKNNRGAGPVKVMKIELVLDIKGPGEESSPPSDDDKKLPRLEDYGKPKTSQEEIESELGRPGEPGSGRLKRLEELSKNFQVFGDSDVDTISQKRYEEINKIIDETENRYPNLKKPTAGFLKDLVTRGVSAAWSRPGPNYNVLVQYGATAKYYNVTTIARQAEAKDADNKLPSNVFVCPVMLPSQERSYNSSGQGRSVNYYNYGFMVTKELLLKRKDLDLAQITTLNSDFAATCAHEVGHVILNLLFCNGFSASHKFTSYWGEQKTHERSPGQTSFSEIDPMKYYKFDLGSGQKVASENDVRAIIHLSQIQAEFLAKNEK